LDETQSHLCAAYDREYLSKEEFATLFREGTEIRKITVGFIRSMIMPRGGVKSIRPREQWSRKVWEIYERVTGKPAPEMFRSAVTPNNGQDAEP
jgi:hypothetical protein